MLITTFDKVGDIRNENDDDNVDNENDDDKGDTRISFWLN
jgi:hypothetical protein